MPITVKTDAYEGPLDLLLNLIKISKIDIYNIPIALITDQYIEHLNSMEKLDLEIASEFLIMAATLIEIKSRMLLPKIKESSEAFDLDPRVELVDKLIVYKKYKDFALRLKEIESDNIIYFKPPEIIDDIDDDEVLFKNISLNNLMLSFKKVLNIYEKKFNSNTIITKDIGYDEYKIEDKMNEIKALVKSKGKVLFENFFINSSCRTEIIVIFLSMLELIKIKIIKVSQYENYGDIFIEGQEGLWKTC